MEDYTFYLFIDLFIYIFIYFLYINYDVRLCIYPVKLIRMNVCSSIYLNVTRAGI